MLSVDLTKCRVSARVYINASYMPNNSFAIRELKQELRSILSEVITEKDNVIEKTTSPDKHGIDIYTTSLYVFTVEEFNALIIRIKESNDRPFLAQG